MNYLRKEVYDMFDEVFIKVHILTDAYQFFYNMFEANQNSCTAKERIQLCNLLHIFDQYATQIQADINSIYEQILPEY